MVQTIIVGTIVLAVAIMLMGVRIFFTRKGSFPNTHISASQAMKDRGITCASSQEREANEYISPVKELLKSDSL